MPCGWARTASRSATTPLREELRGLPRETAAPILARLDALDATQRTLSSDLPVLIEAAVLGAVRRLSDDRHRLRLDRLRPARVGE